jgi:hypothetical protein
MKSRVWLLLAVCIVVGGCTGSTAVSNQPSQAEIQQGVERRVADIDKMSGLSAEAKERMKAQIRGNQPDPNRK